MRTIVSRFYLLDPLPQHQVTNVSIARTRPGQAKLLPASSPHLVTVSGSGEREDLLYSCKDTASNNLMAVSLEDLELNRFVIKYFEPATN